MKTVFSYPIEYHGNIIWPILFLIIFLPLGVLILINGLRFKHEDGCYGIHYRGSKGWLIFWTIVFFPVAVILGFINGIDMVKF